MGRSTRIAAVVAALLAVAGIVAVVLVARGGDDPSEAAGDLGLAAGDCFGNPPDVAAIAEVEEVGCEAEHDAEAFLVADLRAGADAAFPGQEAVDQDVLAACEDGFEGYVGIAYERSDLELFPISPGEETWEDGDRRYVCALFDPEGPTSGSARGSER